MSKIRKLGVLSIALGAVLAFVLWPLNKSYATVPHTGALVNYNYGNTASSYYNSTIGGGYHNSVSADGRYVVFVSDSADVVSGDTNNKADAFVRDLSNNTTTRVSVNTAGYANLGTVTNAYISSNGRYVVFDATSGTQYVYLRDTQAGTTTMVSVKASGSSATADSQAAGVSDDGRFVLFTSFDTGLVSGLTTTTGDVYVRDMKTGTNKLVSSTSTGAEPNDQSGEAVMSCDGRFIVYTSPATNVVSGDTNGQKDVFVVDRVAGDTTNITISADGESDAPTISCNGKYVGFKSSADNLVSGDTNAKEDGFVYNTETGSMSRVTTDSSGNQANDTSWSPTVSDSGKYTTFLSKATNLTTTGTNSKAQVYFKNLQTGATETVSTYDYGSHNAGSWDASNPVISADGTKIVLADADQLLGSVSYSSYSNQNFTNWNYYAMDTGVASCTQ